MKNDNFRDLASFLNPIPHRKEHRSVNTTILVAKRSVSTDFRVFRDSENKSETAHRREGTKTDLIVGILVVE